MPRKHRLLWSVCIGHLTNDVFTSMVPVVLTFLAAGMPAHEQCADWSRGQLVAALWRVHSALLWHPGRSQRGTLDWFAWPRIPRLYVHTLDPDGGLHAAILADVRSPGDRHHRQRRFASGRRIARGPESIPRRSTFNMAIFFLMGQTGLALGPAIAGILLDLANPDLLGRLGQTVGLNYFRHPGQSNADHRAWHCRHPRFPADVDQHSQTSRTSSTA